MSCHIYAVSDFGVVVKMEELDLGSMKSFFEEERDITFDDTYSLEEQLINLLMDGYAHSEECSDTLEDAVSDLDDIIASLEAIS